MTKPIVRVEERPDATRVRVACGSAEVWVRATPGGRRLEISIDEGEGEVAVEWSIRRVHVHEPPVVTGPFVQSPVPFRGEDRTTFPAFIAAALAAQETKR